MSGITIILGASETTGSGETLRIFVAAAVVALIALLLTTRLSKRFQRIRPVAALMSSGWLAIGVGFLLSPSALNVLQPDTLLEMRPLLLIGLGWIGLIVGLQAHRQVLLRSPRSLWKLTLVDALGSVVIAGCIAALLLLPRLPVEHRTVDWFLLPMMLLGCATIGWAPETRSLQDRRDAPGNELAMTIRAASGLASLLAVALLGITMAFVVRTGGGAQHLNPAAGGLTLLAALALAVLAGAGSRSLLTLAGADRSQTLVVFLGTVTLVAGIAARLQFSPLFAAMLVGAVISNLGGTHLRSFEWFILRAEPAVANIFFLLAGVLLEPRIGGWGWGIIALLVSARLLLKPLLLRWWFTGAQAVKGSTLRRAPLRQSPIAIALAVGLVLAETSPLNMRLLTMVVLVGLISELLPTAMSLVVRRKSLNDAAEQRSAEEQTDATPPIAGAEGAVP